MEGTATGRQSLATDTGQKIRFNDLDAAPGIILVDATSPEQIAADAAAAAEKAKKRTPAGFLPGEVLAEDIKHFGYAGDVVRLNNTGYGPGRPVAVSPETGQIKDGALHRVQAGEWKTTAPLRLTEEQKTTLYGAPQFSVPVDNLRPGDVVAATEIDNKAMTKQPVTITQVDGGGTVNIRYRNDELTGEGKKRSESEVTVLDRTHGALNGHELLTLARPEAGLPPRIGLRHLIRQQPAGQHVLLDLPSGRDDLPGGFVTGRIQGIDEEHKSSGAGRSYTVHHFVIETAENGTGSGSGHGLPPPHRSGPGQHIERIGITRQPQQLASVERAQ
ncbi:hypothetical protein AB0E44_11050 [Micrococcus terreus]|uniref:hypothetical protein n=1 Tax=Micrococcus terreus TaxID=574650 RepID=UPI0033FD4C95